MPTPEDQPPNDSRKRDRAMYAILADVGPNQIKPASAFMKAAWERYERYRSVLACAEGKREQDYGSLNGSVFQALVERALLASGIQPIYSQAEMAFIAVAIYDIIVYTEECGPVNLSLKTTIRERWKQADLEGSALKNVHKRAKVYVVNNSPNETLVRQAALHNCIAIDRFVICTDVGFDELIEQIRGWKPKSAPTMPLVRHCNFVLGADEGTPPAGATDASRCRQS
jgi:hypothetical protein